MSSYKNLPEQLPKEKQATASVKELVEGNLKLVVYLAHQFSNDENIIEDLMQEGAMGLQKAAERFDPKRKCSFGTYAAFWIKQKIRRYMQDHSSLVRVPNHQFGKKGVGKKYKEAAKNALTDVFSISQNVNFESEDGFDIKDEDAKIPDSECDISEFNGILSQLMADHLDEREWIILTERFNLQNKYDKPLTLDELGVRFNLTRERIRQIEAKALRKLRFQLDSTERGEPEIPNDEFLKANSSIKPKRKGGRPRIKV